MKYPFIMQHYFLVWGVTGVMIFFSISGFLITYLLLNEKKANGRINFRNFLIRRFLRLFPPLFVFFIVLLVLMQFNLVSKNHYALLISFVYLYNFVSRHNYVTELAHTWSLGVEEQFYLFWPLVINYITKLKNIFFVSLLIILLCFIIYLFYPALINASSVIRYLSENYFIDRWFFPACLPIMIGALSAIALMSKKDKLQFIFSKKYLMPVIAFLLYFSSVFINIPSQLIYLFGPTGVCLTLLWIYFNQESMLVKVLEFEPVAFIGKISYGIYIYQGLFLRTGPGGELFIQQFPVNICLVLIMSVLSYFLLEKKIIKYKEKFKNIPETPSLVVLPSPYVKLS